MKTVSNLASVFVCLSLIPQLALAVPHYEKRQASASATVDTAAGPTLEPVLPPQQDTSDLNIINPDKAVQLAYAGVSTGPLTKRDDSVILVEFDFTFKYPTVALDHSDYITSVSCSSDGELTAQINDADAYALAKESWGPLGDLILITAVEACGGDAQNDLFLATAVDFDDSDNSFTASGSHVTFHDALRTMDVKWGNAPSDTLTKRFAHQRRDEPDETATATLDIGYMISEQVSAAEDAPWPGAVLLASWGLDDKEEGESKKRDLASTTELAVRGEDEGGFDAGLNIYCVDCGVKGSIIVTGMLSWGFFDGITLAQVRMSGNMYAGMYLGLEMFAVYKKEYEKNLIKKSLNPWTVPGLIDFGPYVRLAVSAGIEIKAEGTLLIGASATWGNFEAFMDLISGESSSSTSGFTPVIDRKAEAEVSLSAEATLGMPIGIGVGISILDLFTDSLSIGCELTDTPGIKAEASYSFSVGKDEEEEEEDTCSGIDWSIKLENKLGFSVIGAYNGYWDLIEPYESEPLADGCITFGDDDGNNDGGDDNDDGSDDGSGDDNGDGEGDDDDDGEDGEDNGDDGDDDGNTTPGRGHVCVSKNERIPASLTCKAITSGPSDKTSTLLGPSQAKKRRRCVKRCLANNQCQSIGWNQSTKVCQMYSASVESLGMPLAKGKAKEIFGDRSCWRTTPCAK
ncbi:uncharacterized protein LTR77_004138 [Saxophila tyrrhenica]|uniref:Apple domain-containing protein n=1 Tax=Saxophila tyrrhenica TaxID=1690608 RepID=A0AAV9PEF3_9PEZI|nr:hypothetical protein LTR77_004138 [Saxophila tyrrhenica]